MRGGVLASGASTLSARIHVRKLLSKSRITDIVLLRDRGLRLVDQSVRRVDNRAEGY